MIEFVLPFPPSQNGLYANAYKVGRVKTKRYLKWIGEATHAMMQQHPGINPLKPMFSCDVEVIYRFSPPNKVVRDLNNLYKATDDFMVMFGVLKDDSLITKVASEFVNEGNGVYICVKEKNNEKPI